MLTPKTLAQFKENLLERQKDLRHNLQTATETFINDDPQFADALDTATNVADKNLLAQLRTRESQILKDVERALGRIDDGSFGTCLKCEEEIALNRLLANPYTQTCLMCQTENEAHKRRVRVPAPYENSRDIA